MDERIAIFGAGQQGVLALNEYGKDKVVCFIDNNPTRWGELLEGIRILNLQDYREKFPKTEIVIASLFAADKIAEQLRENGISHYSVYEAKKFFYYPPGQLIYNPYKVNEDLQEDDWKQTEKLDEQRIAVRKKANELYERDVPLFQHIEVETYNRCNGGCSFCPINRNIDPRPEIMMTEELFKKIVDELESLDYDGRFAPFSNNEPLLDDRIIELTKYAREHLKRARIHMYTNGTLLTIDKFLALAKHLDELIIDNYNQELQLIRPVANIVEYCEKHVEMRFEDKVTIVLRKPVEIMTSRGGTAPNRKDVGDYPNDACVLPYTQIIIRPDGKVSLCCNDALGRYTLGDASRQTLKEIWYGKPYMELREKLYHGRKNFGNCRKCDTFNLF